MFTEKFENIIGAKAQLWVELPKDSVNTCGSMCDLCFQVCARGGKPWPTATAGLPPTPSL